MRLRRRALTGRPALRVAGAALLGAAAWDMDAVAQDAPVTVTPPVVVSASRIPAPLARTPASVTVITREEIEARHPGSVIELLRQVSGLHIDRPGGRGSVSSVYLRGGDPNFTMVLVDGVQVNDPTNSRGGSYDFSRLALEQIERIEVVRGPLSAVHGSDAMSGVINIVTRQGGKEPERSILASAGRFGERRVAASARGPLGEARYALGASLDDGGEPVEGGKFVGRDLSLGITAPPFKDTVLRASLRYSDADLASFPDDSGGPRFAVRRATDERDVQEVVAGLDLTHEIRPWWEYGVQFGLYDRSERLTSPGVAPGLRDPFGIPPNSGDTDFRRYTLQAANRLMLGSAATVTAGGEARYESGSSRSTLLFGGAPVAADFERDRRILAPFAELQVTPGDNLLLQASLRWDFPDAFDSEVSPRLGASYAFATGTTLRASWGEGFKLPSFFALGNPIVGNPDLRPETSESFELGVSQEFWRRRATASVTYFQSRFFDIVDFEEGPPPRLVNRSRVDARGAELALELRPMPRLSLAGHATYTRTDIAGTDERLRNRPEWRGGATAAWRTREDLTVSLSALYVGNVFDSSIPTGDRTLDAYLRLDAAVDWMPRPGWTLFLAVDNLLNADYEEAVGFPAPGMRPRVGARIAF